MSEEEKKMWWDISKKGPYVISKCCKWPISSPEYRFNSGRVLWRCSKPRCRYITDEHGIILNEEPEVVERYP